MSSTDTTVAARQPLSILQRFDRQLGRVTMYRLVVLALAALVVLAFASSAVGTLPYAPQDLALSLLVLLGVAYLSNRLYAVLFAVRLTSFGLRQVSVVSSEVGRSFGSTNTQLLGKVQLPLARKTVLLGLNQVIMMAFGIVVIASQIGTGDVGNQVLGGLQHLDANLSRRDAADIDLHPWMLLPEALDQRQQDVDRRLVRADQDPAALQVAQVAHRAFRLLRQAHQPLGVIQQHPARLRQLAVLGRAVEQPLAEVLLQPADRLAHGGLRSVQPGRGAREAALGGDGQKYLEFSKIHAWPAGWPRQSSYFIRL